MQLEEQDVISITEVGWLILLDMPGWSHETSDIKSQYKKILRERQLVSEHTPHIVMFCIAVSTLRRNNPENRSKEHERSAARFEV